MKAMTATIYKIIRKKLFFFFFPFSTSAEYGGNSIFKYTKFNEKMNGSFERDTCNLLMAEVPESH